MDEPRGENAGAQSRHWPPHDPPDDSVSVKTACARCDQPWRIHRDLSGYRMRCVCGGWVRVPYPELVLRSARAAAELRATSEALPRSEAPRPRRVKIGRAHV